MKTKKKQSEALLAFSTSLLALSASKRTNHPFIFRHQPSKSHSQQQFGLITPLDWRQVDSNLVQSAVIKLNDTSYCQVFDTGSNFYKGGAVIHGLDSIYRCKVSLHHGVWSNPDFQFVQRLVQAAWGGSGTANYVPIYTSSATLGNSTITDNFSGSQPTSFNNKYGVLLIPLVQFRVYL